MKILQALKNKILREEQVPGFLGFFMNPFYFARSGVADEMKAMGNFITGKTLDIGCGSKPYASFFQSSKYIGLEMDTPASRTNPLADVFYDGKKIPFADAEFDSLISSQVFEHVFEPNQFLTEANRVLKMKGHFLLSVPFMWDEHEKPYDYARYSSFGMKWILEKNGFEVVEYRKSLPDLRAIFQLINCYFYQLFKVQNKMLNFFLPLLWVPFFNITGLVLGKVLPKNEDIFLNSVILCRKVSAARATGGGAANG